MHFIDDLENFSVILAMSHSLPINCNYLESESLCHPTTPLALLHTHLMKGNGDGVCELLCKQKDSRHLTLS
jgi:hypothetical protein